VDQVSALRPDGRRNFVVPADVGGRFTVLRRIVFALLILIYAATPWIEIGGHPALFLDIQHRAFYLFGATFNAQDFWLAFFLLSGVGFLLILATALLGRVWCGYACPQTVFLDGVFRRVERLIEGPRNQRLKRDAGPVTASRGLRKVVKHVAFIAIAFVVAHVFLSYFVSIPALFEMMRDRPSEHPEAFAWALGMTGVMYFNFAWFREQLCVIICPYGRLQSVLTDSNTLVIGYDQLRGEPRGKAKEKGHGDCVDCGRCVVVCPTGIDIRNGLQLECIGCAACIDACDDVMHRLERAPGLIRYDSLNGLRRKPKRFFRPRVYLYAFLGLVGLAVATFALQKHTHFEANLLRLQGAPFVLDADKVRNALELHLVNKRGSPVTFALSAADATDIEYVFARRELTLAPLGEQRVPVFAIAPNDKQPRRIRIRIDDGAEPRIAEVPFVAPK
jgi:cytochrome c oxidase accessory protein FixG